MTDEIDVRRKDGDLWICCNDEALLPVLDDEAVDLALKLIQATPGQRNSRRMNSAPGDDDEFYYGDVSVSREEALAHALNIIRSLAPGPVEGDDDVEE